MIPSKLILAPMDGVIDAPMRRVLTSSCRYDYCESEFVRVSGQCVTSSRLLSMVPELRCGGVTAAGTPVYVQILGQEPEICAASAELACRLGAPGIDLNFGCPARQVNKSGGGAALLKDPDLMHGICCRVRDVVPAGIPLTAKMRLGWDSSDRCLELAEQIWSAGVDALCVHGRTREDGYATGTVRWDLIARIREACPVPVIANGDVFDRASAMECSRITGCDSLMLARGAVSLPNLADVIRLDAEPFSYRRMVEAVVAFTEAFREYSPDRDPFPRVKQFLSYLRGYYNAMVSLNIFRRVCACGSLAEAISLLQSSTAEADQLEPEA